MSAMNFVHSARFAGAWLVLAVLTMTFSLQLLAQLRGVRTASLLAASLCIQTVPADPAASK
jgi:hypothetical protein